MLLDDYLDYLQEKSFFKKILSKLKRKKPSKPKELSRAERRSRTIEYMRKKRETEYRRARLKRKGII